MAPLLFLGFGTLIGLIVGQSREAQEPRPKRSLPAPQTKPNSHGILASDPMRSPSGGPGSSRSGVQSHPDYQWSYVVQTDSESPGSIADKILGSEQAWRYVELLTANPSKPIKGKVVTPDPNDDELNFVSLSVGERLLIPRSWNAWIDETGVPSGKSQVWPAPVFKGGAQ